MTDCARCGDCCTSFPLNTPERADIWGKRILASIGRNGAKWHYDGAYRKLAAWAANLIVVSGPERTQGAALRWFYRCPVFNEQTRLCGDHANRPSLCVRFPWYGREVQAGDYKSLSPRCSFVADDPSVRMLPIVGVSHGRTDRGAEDDRHSAA